MAVENTEKEDKLLIAKAEDNAFGRTKIYDDDSRVFKSETENAFEKERFCVGGFII